MCVGVCGGGRRVRAKLVADIRAWCERLWGMDTLRSIDLQRSCSRPSSRHRRWAASAGFSEKAGAGRKQSCCCSHALLQKCD